MNRSTGKTIILGMPEDVDSIMVKAIKDWKEKHPDEKMYITPTHVVIDIDDIIADLDRKDRLINKLAELLSDEGTWKYYGYFKEQVIEEVERDYL